MNAPAGTTSPRPSWWWQAGTLIGLTVILAGGLTWWFGWLPRTPAPIPTLGDLSVDPEVLEAIKNARDAVARSPRDARLWGVLGQIYHVHKFHDQAMACYAEAQHLDPSDSQWPYLRAVISLTGPEPAQALPDLRRAARLPGSDVLPRLRLGELLMDLGQFDEASETFGQVLQTQPDEPRARLRLAQLATSRQQWTRCLEHLEPLGTRLPISRQIATLRLQAYQHLGNQEAVTRELGKLAELPEDQPWPDPCISSLSRFHVGGRARVLQALSAFQQGQQRQGLEQLEQVIQEYPGSAIAWAALGRTRALVGDLPAAETALRRSLDLDPYPGDVWLALGTVQFRRENPTGALECFRKVNQLKPADADAHCRVADCLILTGDRAGAADSYRQALRYRPDHREAKEGLARLSAP